MTSHPYGMLTDYTTGEEIRPATQYEYYATKEAGETGAFKAANGQMVFVSGGSDRATPYYQVEDTDVAYHGCRVVVIGRRYWGEVNLWHYDVREFNGETIWDNVPESDLSEWNED